MHDIEYVGSSVKQDKLDKMIERNVLMQGEAIKAVIWGKIESSRIPLEGQRSKDMGVDLIVKATTLDRRSGLIGLTDKRVIFYMPKMMDRYEFEAYDIEQVDSVTFTKGMRRGRIDITIVNSNRVIKHINNDEGHTMVDYIQNAIHEIKKKQQSPTTVVTEQSPLDALKMKFVNGEITTEEYEKMKSVLEG